jgi:hypothetical protein
MFQKNLETRQKDVGCQQRSYILHVQLTMFWQIIDTILVDL